MRLKVLRSVYPDDDERFEIRELKSEVTLREKRLQLNVKDHETMLKKLLLTDPLYNAYFYQISELETKELELRIREARLHSKVAICEEALKNMPTIEKGFSAIQREIDLYTALQVDLATKRETARATVLSEKQRESRVRVIGRSYPDRPIGLAPILIMAALCLVPPLFVAGMLYVLPYYKYIQLKENRGKQEIQKS